MGSTMVLDVVELAAESGQKISHVGEVYLEISQGLSIGWLRERIENLEVSGRWEATARSRLREGLLAVHRQLAANLLRRGTSQPGTTLVLDWLAQQGPQIQRTKQMLLDIRGQIDIDFPALTVAVRELQQLADS
jgi:glutamate dehydrogenase